MANNGGMLQGKITPDSSYTIDVAETGGSGGSASNFEALGTGDTGYWSTDILGDIGTNITGQGTLAATYTLTLNATTGVITINASGGSITDFAITWDSTTLRDLLGFDGTETATGSAGDLDLVGNDSAKAVWIPNCPFEQPFGVSDAGWYEYDAANTQAPDGTVVATAYNRRTALTLEWMAVAAARTRIADETTANQSYQQFYDDCIYGAQAWANPGGPVRWFPDRTVTGTSTEYKVPVEMRTSASRLEQNWSGLYTVAIPRLVKVPA